MDAVEVIAILERLREQAAAVEAEVGVQPTAEEALRWALAEVKALPQTTPPPPR